MNVFKITFYFHVAFKKHYGFKEIQPKIQLLFQYSQMVTIRSKEMRKPSIKHNKAKHKTQDAITLLHRKKDNRQTKKCIPGYFSFLCSDCFIYKFINIFWCHDIWVHSSWRKFICIWIIVYRKNKINFIINKETLCYISILTYATQHLLETKG